MSQIGRKIINIPDDVNVTNENNNIIVKGKLGELGHQFDKEMIIDKIRHFAFILREHKKSEQKAMGVDCTPLELNDIKIVSTKDGDEPKVQAIICQNTDSFFI